MIKLITSNTKQDIQNLLNNIKGSFLMICPFIGSNTSKLLADIIKKRGIKSTIITRFSRIDFYNKVSSLEGLKILKEAGCELKAVKRLHTKLYIFDSNAMILGSSNFTDGGLMTNIELNILIQEEKSIINHGITYFNEIDINIDKKFMITEEMILNEISYLKSFRDGNKTSRPKSLEQGQELPTKKTIDNLEELLSPKNSSERQTTTSWIKFEGFSDSRRTKNDAPLKIELDNENCYQTRFPKKPTGYKDGDIIFIARNSWDKDNIKTPIIYGYGITRKFDKNNIMPKELQEKDDSFKRWPYFIYVEHFRFIKTTLIDGLSLLEVYNKVGYNTYSNSRKRKSSFDELKRIHGQKDKLKITEEAKDYILTRLNEII